ncbi:hypothetical protein BU23DRAFT_552325 [Bimuria novae-zelandiae CBS 107.79]|uniref:C2H2-type domain-containing protein n=1 Tax=Bimuria novae-zelandiae CBS 107.79 TaxID=1447943 RepID=A0A6A5VFA0_9PLEO|nr:hypothetical protein BU23DRAFT_552325 [Bimuria novae-zelandiae CBS 107.79]
MERPAKRMRILQSIGVDEVDENNPEYLEGKKQNSEWLKNRWDAIYAKYGAMPDMMSDELDMRGEGKIVVDRGHMRKLEREYRKRLGQRSVKSLDDVQLVDDMFANDPEMDGGDDEDSDCDERDELAPSPSPEPASLGSDAFPAKQAQNEPKSPSQTDNQIGVPVPDTPKNATVQAALAASTNPTADLIQLVQFPQTPAGQQAQRAFEAQTVRAVQQAVATIFSSLISHVPIHQPQQSNLPQVPITPTVTLGEVAPATAPNFHRLPLLPSSESSTVPQSSPLPVTQSERRKRRSFAIGVHITQRQNNCARATVPFFSEDDLTDSAGEQRPQQPSTVKSAGQSAVHLLTKRPQEPRRQYSRYTFTAEDDQYIIESRMLHNRKWSEIMNSRPHWKDWHEGVFWARWRNKLSAKAEEYQSSGLGKPQGPSDQVKQRNDAEVLSSPTAGRHLPTPSSLEHGEVDRHEEEPMSGNVEEIIASGGHFDDDEKDLLSLYGEDVADALSSNGECVEETQEIPETHEDSIQQILQGTVTRENTVDQVAASVEMEITQPEIEYSQNTALPVASGPSPPSKIATSTAVQQTPLKKKAVAIPSSSSKSKSKPIITYQVESDNDDQIDLVGSNPPTPTNIHQCPKCKQTFLRAASLRTHENQPHPKEVPYRASSPLPVATQFDPFATQHGSPPPATPTIKREPLDAPRNLLSSPVFKTPMSAPQIKGLSSSGAKSSGKMSRVAYNKVKASWARKGTPVPKKRKSWNATPRKRFWEEFDDGMEDELAM